MATDNSIYQLLPQAVVFRVRVQMYKLSLGLRGKRNFVSSALHLGVVGRELMGNP